MDRPTSSSSRLPTSWEGWPRWSRARSWWVSLPRQGSLDRAVEKAKRKGSDLTVANDVTRTGSGFGSDTNEVALIGSDGTIEHWPLLTKQEVASRLWDKVGAALTDAD